MPKQEKIDIADADEQADMGAQAAKIMQAEATLEMRALEAEPQLASAQVPKDGMKTKINKE